MQQMTAVVTGGAKNIGAAICRALAHQGYRVVVNYKTSSAKAETLAHEIGGIPYRADVTNAQAMREMFSSIGGADVLVLNAAISQYGVFQDAARDWKRVFDVNVGGVVNCVEAALPHMLREKHGSVVAVTSVWSERGASCESIYAASKAAVTGLVKSLALEFAPSGIRVNAVSPGVIASGMTTAAFNGTELDSLRNLSPLGALGEPRDVADAVAFLCSDAARYITGQTLPVNW